MIKVSMPHGKFALIDDIDKDLLQHNWSETGNGYAQARINGKIKHMHTIIVERKTGITPSMKVHTDHINHNGLDNRRDNLRIATRTQNAANKVMQSNNTSGYRGVVFTTTKTTVKGKEYSYDYWTASIKKDRKKIFIGKYKTAREAAIAYNEKARELFGEFAYQNPI